MKTRHARGISEEEEEEEEEEEVEIEIKETKWFE